MNHVTSFLGHVAASFVDQVISFLQPTFQNSNGRFTTLVLDRIILGDVPGALQLKTSGAKGHLPVISANRAYSS